MRRGRLPKGVFAPALAGVFAGMLAAIPVESAAQPPTARPQRAQKGDTVRSGTLDAVVITADRAPSAVSATTAAVTRLTAADLAHLPHASLADVLRLVPGFALVSFDGLGFDPQVMVRGFYGGGEAEYVTVLLDGRPLAQLQTGLVSWHAIPPLEAIEAVEIVRGSGSALYGDAAIGGVINLVTRRAGPDASPRWSASGGGLGAWRASADVPASIAGRALSVSGGVDRTAGFRAHAARVAGRVHARVALAATDRAALALSVRSHTRDSDDPGPLLQSLLDADPASSDVLFRFDHTRDRDHAVGLEGHRLLGARTRVSGSLSGEYRTTNLIRTIALAPGYGDTKEREATNGRVAGALQLDVEDSPLPGADHLTLGAELTGGSLDSKYWRIATGDRDAYRAATGARNGLDASGEGTRTIAAVFAQYALQLSPRVRLSLGGRYDHIDDSFDPRAPSTELHAAARHSAFSPKAGLNLRYRRREGEAGNLYVTASRSFKAPTLDQLFDQRSIPVPFAPFDLRTANPQLVPQFGSNLETGVYHSESLGSAWRGALSISVYQMEMKDELDFDLQALRYVNIGRSRHRGAEAGLRLTSAGRTSAYVNYTLQSATSQRGDFAGKRLKAIPRHAFGGGFEVAPVARVATALTVTHARGAPLDDANTVVLPAFTRADLHASGRLGPVRVVVEVRNVFGARYSPNGFPDPSGSGEAYFYPAAGRVIEIGLRGGW